MILEFQSTTRIIDTNFEYPRSNNSLRQIHKEQWLKYYACLIKRYAQIKSEKILHPVALIVLEGTSVILKCEICISPLVVYEVNTIEWYFNSSSNNNITNELIQSTQHTLVSQNSKHLKMYNIQLEQDGQYWCQMKDTIGALYYLHVDNGHEGIDIVHSDAVPKVQHPASSEIITDYNLKLYTTWTNWSPCSKCANVGIKIRYGYCTLSLLENPVYHASIDDDNLNENIQYIMETLFYVFQNKLPCKFRYIPNHIRKHIIIKQRKIEMMIKYCKKNCSNDVVFEVYNKVGKIIESANNSASIYSMIQKIPSLVPEVTRTILYGTINKKMQIKCPGNLNIETPIIWKIGIKILPFNKYHSNSTIFIDSRMRIVFKKLKFTDSNIYSCWQNNQLAGTVKLIVTGETELKLNYQYMMFGTIAIVSVFTVVIWRVLKGKTRFTKH
ncbi:hypothetical protein HZH68_012967 [Vespula germanica]|uniref:Ig-like domain-containing protein n=1 Tax=Vespula germanica TaxID=30212 RepID=A0A834MWP1_VESGE|nr:hypothetical protein HZH68_012967 [Vespula germanica]